MIAEARKALGLSQSELAEVLGVHPQTVSAWERSKQEPPRYIELALEALQRRHKALHLNSSLVILPTLT